MISNIEYIVVLSKNTEAPSSKMNSEFIVKQDR